MNDPRVEALVDFWSAQLMNVGRIQPAPNPFASGQAAARLTNQNRPVPTAEQAALFRIALRQDLCEQLKTQKRVTIGTEYQPDATLSAALEKAGIRPSISVLPWKTMSWIRPMAALIGDGYRAAPLVAAVTPGARLFVLEIDPGADIFARKNFENDWPEAVYSFTSSTSQNDWFCVTCDPDVFGQFNKPPVIGWRYVTLEEARDGLVAQRATGRQDYSEEEYAAWNAAVAKKYHAKKVQEAAAFKIQALHHEAAGEDFKAKQAWHAAGDKEESAARFLPEEQRDFSEAIGCWCRMGFWGGALKLAMELTPAQLQRLPGFLAERGIPDLIFLHSPQTYNRQTPAAVKEESGER